MKASEDLSTAASASARGVFTRNLQLPATPFGQTVLMLVVATVVLAIRQPGQVIHPQFWAEDGMVFYSEQYRFGLAAFLRTSAGYYHLLPRLIALVISPMPMIWAPTFYVVAAWIVSLATVWIVAESRAGLPYQRAAALIPLLIPIDGEVYLNPTNLQWLTAIVLIVWLLQPPLARVDPGTRGVSVRSPAWWRSPVPWELLGIGVLGLTGPFIVGLLPFIGLRFFWYRQSHRLNLAILGVATAVATVQIHALASATVSAGHSINPHFGVWLDAVAWVYPACLFSGEDLITVMPAGVWYAFSIGLIGFFTVALRRISNAKRATILVALAVAVDCMAMAYARVINNPLSHDPFIGGRYFVIPYTFTLLAIWALLDHPTRWIRRTACGLLLASLLGSLLSFVTTPRDDQRWAEHVRAWEAGNREPIPINPPGWSVRLE